MQSSTNNSTAQGRLAATYTDHVNPKEGTMICQSPTKRELHASQYATLMQFAIGWDNEVFEWRAMARQFPVLAAEYGAKAYEAARTAESLRVEARRQLELAAAAA